MKVNIKKLREDTILPTRGTIESAGWDLYANIPEELNIAEGETYLVGTGIAMEIPKGYMGLIFARSGLATKCNLAPANKVGVVDSDYRGEIKVALHRHFGEASESTEYNLVKVKPGDRIAQLVLVPYLNYEMELVDELDDTERGDGGFGSTGR